VKFRTCCYIVCQYFIGFNWIQSDSTGLDWIGLDLLCEWMFWWLQLSFFLLQLHFFLGTCPLWYLWLFQATAKNAKGAKARFAETSMARTDSACENGETATYDFLVWAWSWHSWTLWALSYSALCTYANSPENSCLEAQGDIVMVPSIPAQGHFSLHCFFITLT